MPPTSLSTPENIINAWQTHLNNLRFLESPDPKYTEYLLGRLRRCTKDRSEYEKYVKQLALIKLTQNFGEA